jgi:hypothetical protein
MQSNSLPRVATCPSSLFVNLEVNSTAKKNPFLRPGNKSTMGPGPLSSSRPEEGKKKIAISSFLFIYTKIKTKA